MAQWQWWGGNRQSNDGFNRGLLLYPSRLISLQTPPFRLVFQLSSVTPLSLCLGSIEEFERPTKSTSVNTNRILCRPEGHPAILRLLTSWLISKQLRSILTRPVCLLWIWHQMQNRASRKASKAWCEMIIWVEWLRVREILVLYLVHSVLIPSTSVLSSTIDLRRVRRTLVRVLIKESLIVSKHTQTTHILKISTPLGNHFQQPSCLSSEINVPRCSPLNIQ